MSEESGGVTSASGKAEKLNLSENSYPKWPVCLVNCALESRRVEHLGHLQRTRQYGMQAAKKNKRVFDEPWVNRLTPQNHRRNRKVNDNEPMDEKTN